MNEHDRQLLEDLLVELRTAQQGGLVVRLPDSQLDEIAARVHARVDERLSAREPPPDTPPARRGPAGR